MSDIKFSRKDLIDRILYFRDVIKEVIQNEKLIYFYKLKRRYFVLKERNSALKC